MKVGRLSSACMSMSLKSISSVQSSELIQYKMIELCQKISDGKRVARMKRCAGAIEKLNFSLQ